MKSKSVRFFWDFPVATSDFSGCRLTPWADPECGLAHGVDQAALGMCPTCNASDINGMVRASKGRPLKAKKALFQDLPDSR